jgi:magnesium transporter
VVDERGRILGRLTVDVMLDTIRDEAEDDLLRRDGLSGEEDLFGPVWPSARRRWLWLAVNLMTAFCASRVIGLFAGSIEQLVALATLLPIVASVGGNTGNQTVALFVRGLAMDQINTGNIRYLSFKEAAISAINGLIWGSVMGLVAFAIYWNVALGLVMAAAMLLNLILAAVVGIAVPAAMHRLGRDPAFGSSVLLTFMTDSMGFFIFLGLATLFLLH